MSPITSSADRAFSCIFAPRCLSARRLRCWPQAYSLGECPDGVLIRWREDERQAQGDASHRPSCRHESQGGGGQVRFNGVRHAIVCRERAREESISAVRPGEINGAVIDRYPQRQRPDDGPGRRLRIEGQATRAVKKGEYIAIYCVGLGAVNNPPGTGAATPDASSTTKLPVSVVLNGASIPSAFAGLSPGSIGLFQVNAQIPENAPAGNAVTLAVTAGGVTSNTVTIAIQ